MTPPVAVYRHVFFLSLCAWIAAGHVWAGWVSPAVSSFKLRQRTTGRGFRTAQTEQPSQNVYSVAAATSSRCTATKAYSSKSAGIPDLLEDRAELVLSLVTTNLTDDDDEHAADADFIRKVVLSLENSTSEIKDTELLFSPLLGNYNVSYVLPSKPNERPVGGKWRRGPAKLLLSTRRTMQHLLQPKQPDSVAQAVNVIVLSALLDLFRIQVILRGDAYALSTQERERIVAERNATTALSSRTVRADFDPPRIVLGVRNRTLLNLRLGPTSSVVLDTPYCDDNIRIGKGSRGSYFVFTKCPKDDEEANEWQLALEQRPTRKSRLLLVLGATFCVGIRGILIANQSVLQRVGSGLLSAISLLSGTAIAFSTGGIEQDRNRKR